MQVSWQAVSPEVHAARQLQRSMQVPVPVDEPPPVPPPLVPLPEQSWRQTPLVAPLDNVQQP
jgi:hypothetical protein